MGVENADTKLYTSFWRTSQTILTWPSKHLFHNSLFSIKCGRTTSILSQNNKACNGTNESVKIVISLHGVTLFFPVECKQLTTTKVHKIFIAQKLYCACRVLSLATIRSKYYFNFIPIRTRSGQELLIAPGILQCDGQMDGQLSIFHDKSLLPMLCKFRHILCMNIISVAVITVQIYSYFYLL